MESEFTTAGVTVDGHFFSIFDMILWILLVCCCPVLLGILIRTYYLRYNARAVSDGRQVRVYIHERIVWV